MRVLVTGGAGFIGSHIAEDWLSEGHEVVVLDNLETGFAENIPQGVEFIEADIADLEEVRRSVESVELVLHQAASRAVLRSVEDPVATDRSNTLGTLNVLLASRDAGVRRVVVASSSSVYGGVAPVPTSEDAAVAPKSPYAVSKLAGEYYARVFAELFGLETVVLRYFNVFGPRQRPDSRYAGVIPLFMAALASGEPPQVHGDGKQSRDFTYIEDVVRANSLAAEAPRDTVIGRVYNVARGESTTLLELLAHLSRIMDSVPKPEFVDPRPGDVRKSRADIGAAVSDLGYKPGVSVVEGLERTVDWFLSRLRTSASSS
jgi:UDP-glucose 4-epimerase